MKKYKPWAHMSTVGVAIFSIYAAIFLNVLKSVIHQSTLTRMITLWG